MHTITGKELRNKIRGAGLTVGMVCSKAGISQQTATKLFKGEGTVTKESYDKLVAAFDELTKEEDTE